MGSIQRRLNAIAEAHKAVGVESPTHNPIGGQYHEGHQAHYWDGAGTEDGRPDG